ncbi:MAG: colanic acid biosynthesis glycosyl transferase WcaI [Gaiellaceae bacterium]|jgi:glycosyltransferase involved in cell wall biosynthesis|nr:colanic acid biosynthesis glycosyl transferase WcaI [Gaiellaceae bacterium]MDX6473366.1 colanic acid biosynthesis glycosyl transferase WcaI [Gaiellaceae bacterium]
MDGGAGIRASLRRNGERRPRLLVLNQYYWPGKEATANLLTELCEELAADYDVTVIVGAAPGESHRSRRNGVDVIRVRSTTYDRTQLVHRAANYFTYLLGAVYEALSTKRPDVVVAMTDPPFIGAAAQLVARRFRSPLLVISQDVFPEIAVKLGRLKNPLVIGLLRVVIMSYLRFADRVVVIGDTMKERVVAKGVDRDRVRVISNWGDAEKVKPLPRDNRWARKHDLVDKFVVMHFGNVGHAQDLDTLIRATTLLRDLDDLVVPIIGVGARLQELTQLAERVEADKVRFLPWQEYTRRAEPISTAHVHVVGLARGLAGYIVPSRMWGVLAAGRPVIAAAEAESETAAVVRATGCGIVVPPGDPLELATAIRDCHDGVYDLEAMGRLARAHAETETDRSLAVGRYRAVLEEIRGDRRR